MIINELFSKNNDLNTFENYKMARQIILQINFIYKNRKNL